MENTRATVPTENPNYQRVFNTILDLQKLYDCSVETFWMNAFPVLCIETPTKEPSNGNGKAQEVGKH